MNLIDRDHQVVWHPYTQMQVTAMNIAIVKGEGALLFDDTGKTYIDAISSWWVNLHGHSHPYIAEKVLQQLQVLEHVIFAGFTHEPAVKLAECLLQLLPRNQSRIFYSDNGSTATEVAVKMALQYWRNKGLYKSTIIAFEHGYHGDTFGAMSVSARTEFTKPFTDFLFKVVHIPYPERGMENISMQQLQQRIAEEKDNIAAFIFEPLVLGAGGMLMYEASLLNDLISLCKCHSIITIADEVMTGFGRTGKYFASGYLTRQPDIICLSKGITGGAMPLGATSCSEEIYSAFLTDDADKTFYHGHSYTANPLACAAALASYELLIQASCQENIQRIAKRHLHFISSNQQHPVLKNLRCIGTILAMDIATAEQTTYFNSVRNLLYYYFLEKGIILRPLGNTIYVMPPYCITDLQLSIIYNAIESFAKTYI